MTAFEIGTRVRVLPGRQVAGSVGTVSTCPHPDQWVGSEADSFPIVVDLDREGISPDRDWHFRPDELEVIE